MGVMLVGLLLAAAGVSAPADGHTVIPLSKAKANTELSCQGALEGAFLSPAKRGFGVRAPVVPGVVHCTITPTRGKPSTLSLKFLEPKWPLAVGASAPVILGQDHEAVLTVRGKALRAAGSAGEATLENGQVHAALPASKMPQNLVVLVEGEKGGAAYAVVPLLGRATVKVQTVADAKVEALVAGHRSTGFTSDDAGQVALVLPAPVGFTQGDIDVTGPEGRTTHAKIKLPAAKPLYAMAALGPADNVLPGAMTSVLVAGANPSGLPPRRTELKAKVSAGKLKGLSQPQPGLWRLQVLAPASGKVAVELHLGNASQTVTYEVGQPKPKVAPTVMAHLAPPTPPLGLVPQPTPTVIPTPAPTPAPKPAPTAVAEATPAPTPAPVPTPAPEPVVAVAPTVSQRPALHAADEDEENQGLRLELLVEGGFISNGGAVSGIVPGGQLQLAYRVGSFDLGGSVDALFVHSSQVATVPVGSATSIQTGTTTNSLQVLAGPWVRLRVSEVFGIDLSGGVGVSHTSQEIDSAGRVLASASTTPLAYGGFGGIDLDFGLVRAFAGARYVRAVTTDGLQGDAGGLAGLAGIGLDIGL